MNNRTVREVLGNPLAKRVQRRMERQRQRDKNQAAVAEITEANDGYFVHPYSGVRPVDDASPEPELPFGDHPEDESAQDWYERHQNADMSDAKKSKAHLPKQLNLPF